MEEIIKAYAEAREKTNLAYSDYQAMKIEADSLKIQLMEELAKAKLKSAKTEDYFASITQRPTIRIENEELVGKWIKENLPEPEFYFGVKKELFNPVALQQLKETGEIVEGTSVEVNTSLTLRRNK